MTSSQLGGRPRCSREIAVTDRSPKRTELETFLDPLLGFAHDMLRKEGEFYPFGATITSDGQMELTGAHPGDEHPRSKEVIDLMVSWMRSQAEAGKIRAAAICYDVRFRPDDGDLTDAIAVVLEHRAGDRALMVQPYSKGRFTGWRFAQLVAVAPPVARIFVSKADEA
jgi:hypothetical protein